MEFFSHPDKELFFHLHEVRLTCLKSLPGELRKSGEIIAISHDFGKYTSYFQNYLKTGHKEGDLANHSFLSAIFGAHLALQILGEDNILPLVVYNCIIHHHGNLEAPAHDLPKSFKVLDVFMDFNLLEKLELAKRQLADIKSQQNFILRDFRKLGYANYFEQFINEVFLENVLKKLKKLQVLAERKMKDEKNYFIHQLLYSALISADKLSASNTLVLNIKQAKYEKIANAKSKKFAQSVNPIDKLRNEIFAQVQVAIENNFNNSKIFTITSPTGTGKTITGLFAALKLNELLGGNRKIIYSLPFTSIIDQNYQVIDELFQIIDDFKDKSSLYLIKHHNLANLEFINNEINYNHSQAEMLIENWNSGIVVTTFVQLLETLIGNKNRMLKKFTALQNAIILLDEVQAIDIKFYELVEYILEKATEYLDCRVIMMTATRPFILQKKAIELLEKHKKYFQAFNRTQIIPRLLPITIEKFTEEFLERIQNKSYLIVCNTIQQSLDIYEKLRDVDRAVLYLSTNLLPIHRRQRIEAIRNKLQKGEKIIVVSTQVVEAGVDLDFDIVIRDLGPLDSLIQCAGRCNRNGLKSEMGNIFIYNMINERGKQFSTTVYGSTLINLTKSMFSDEEVKTEKEYLNLIQEYFDKIKANKSMEQSREFIESIEKLDFKSDNQFSLNKFSLIENNSGYIDVFFRIDEEAERLYENFLENLTEKNFAIKREKYLQIKNKIRDYIISLPMKKYKNIFVNDKVFFSLPREGCRDYYSNETGFIRNISEDCLIF